MIVDMALIPAARMKAKREHRVPLSRRALEVLQEARRLHDGDLVFPSGRTGRTIPGQTLGATLRRLGIDGTVHGLRSTFRDWAAESGVDRDVAEAALAHQVRNPVEAAYRRTDLFELRKGCMEAWAQHIGEREGVRNP